MKMCSLIGAVATTTIMAGILAAPTRAATLFTDDFESDTVGVQPTTPAWNINASGTNTPAPTANVVSTTSAQSTTTKALSIVNTAGNYLLVGTPSFTTVTSLNGGTVSAQLAIRINSEPSSHDGEDYRLSFSGDGTPTYLRFKPHGASGNAGLSYFDGGSTNVSLLPDLRVGDWYLLWMQADLTSQKYSLSVQNLSEPNQAGASATGINFFGSTSYINQLYFTHVTGNSNFDATIDNVRIDSPGVAVPEPASLMFLGLTGLLMLRRRREA